MPASAWIKFVMSEKKKHPNKTLKQVMKIASVKWKKKKKKT